MGLANSYYSLVFWHRKKTGGVHDSKVHLF